MLILLVVLLVADISWSAGEAESLAQLLSISYEISHLAVSLSLLSAPSETQLIYLVVPILLSTASSCPTVGNEFRL